MTRSNRGKVKTEYGPEALYSYTLVDALLDVKMADRDPYNQAGYHSAMNHFLALAAADIGYYTPAWQKWQERVLRGPGGRALLPTDRLTRADRRIEMAMAVHILRKKGVMGYKDKPFSDDATLIADLLGSSLEDAEESLLDLD